MKIKANELKEALKDDQETFGPTKQRMHSLDVAEKRKQLLMYRPQDPKRITKKPY